LSKVALLSGTTGQDASYLADFLLEKDYEVYGIIRRVSTPNIGNIKHNLDNPHFHLIDGDSTDLPSLIEAFKVSMPDEAYNLSAMSFVGSSWAQPVLSANVTGVGALNFFEAARLVKPNTKVYQASTSEMFSGEVYPQNETTPFHPKSPYGAAKCFTSETKIYTETGLKRIKDIKIGDLVWAHKGRLRRVTDTYERKYKDRMINIRVVAGSNKPIEILQNNFQVTVTPEHPIMTKGGWKKAEDLQEGDLVAVVAKECKQCGGLLPAVQNFCSSKCSTEFQWKNGAEYRANITAYATEREQKHGFLHTPKAKKNRLTSFKKYLKEKGPNYMETYLDLLIQEASPGFFRFVGDGQLDVCGLIPDWINNKEKAIIEFVGWGEGLERREKKTDEKIKRYEEEGYRVLVLYGTEFTKPDILKKKVAAFVSSLGSVQFIYWPIKSITTHRLQLTKSVYNLEVEGDNSYIANGIVSHNCFAHQTARIYRESYGMHISCGILFNHSSPRRGIEFLTQKVVDGAVRQIVGKEDFILNLGNLDSCRDESHAKDFIKGMWMMLQQDNPDDFVLSSEETHSIKEFVDLTYKYLGVTLEWGIYEEGEKSLPFAGGFVNGKRRILVKSVPEFYRPNELNFLMGDSSKARKVLGWKLEYSFQDLLVDMIDSKICEVKYSISR
jgi:GDPmannose 4,6-dehydratase